MTNVAHFIQQCPTCGRRLQVKVDYLGKEVACQHCNAPFYAKDSSSTRNTTQVKDDIDEILVKADQYLSASDLDSELLASNDLPFQ